MEIMGLRDSKRYKRQMRWDLGAEGRLMRKYDSFQIEPGQTAWHDMPEDYKQQFRKFAKLRDKKRLDEADRAEKDAFMEARVAERVAKMEKKFFGVKAASSPPKHDFKAPKKSHTPPKRNQRSIDAQACNFIDKRFFEKRKIEIMKGMKIKENRPRVLLIADVCGWAWWNKSHYLQAYLAEDYDIKVICLIGPEQSGINPRGFDLYVTYGYSYVLRLHQVPKAKRVTGITAHRPLEMLKNYMLFADHVHANSKMLMNELRQIFPNQDNIHYVPNGVDEQIFTEIQPIKTDGKLVAGHVGKRCAAKHQDDIILPVLRDSGVESATNLLDYTNKKPYCEMADFYNKMDVFIVASEEDGTPNPALEAAACGRPIISNRIGNMPEFIKDGYNGFIVGLKPEEYKEKLEYLKNNRDHLIEMGKNARKTVEENWTWKKQAENYRMMFKKIIGR